MKIVSIDVGSGDVKIVLYQDGQLKFTKEINAVSSLPSDALVSPDKSEDLVILDGKSYLIGESAVRMRKKYQYDTDTFDNLKEISPVVIKKYMNLYGSDIDHWVFDISLAYMSRAEELVTHICNTLSLEPSKVTIVPQGIGCKLAYQWKGDSLSGNSSSTLDSFIGIDIGFNTIDTFHCSKGKLTSDGIGAVEQAGIVKIARGIQSFCKSVAEIPLSMAKEAVQTQNVIIFGKPVEGIKECVEALKRKYVEDIFNYIQTELKDLAEVAQGIIFFGGGAEYIRKELTSNNQYGEGFISVPEKPEYYNALGNVYYVLKREKLIN